MPITGNLSTLAFTKQQEKFPHIAESEATGNFSTYRPAPFWKGLLIRDPRRLTGNLSTYAEMLNDQIIFPHITM